MEWGNGCLPIFISGKAEDKEGVQEVTEGLDGRPLVVCQLKFDRLLNLFYDPDIIRIGDENEKETADRY